MLHADVDAAQTAATIFSTCGGTALVIATANFLFKQITGRARRERVHNGTIESQRLHAIEERDAADRNDRRGRDEVSRLRGILLENGLDPGPAIEYEATTKARAARSRIPKE